MEFVLIVAIGLVFSTIGLGVAVIKKGISGESAKKLVGINVTALFGMLVIATILLLPNSAFAVSQMSTLSEGGGLRYLAAALSTGLAAIGAGIAVAATGSAALGAISEEPKMLGKTLIFVGLAEGIAIYGLIVTILILP